MTISYVLTNGTSHNSDPVHLFKGIVIVYLLLRVFHLTNLIGHIE